MELSGALSNPFARDKRLLIRFNELQRRLLDKARDSPLRPRSVPSRPTRVLDLVTLVLTHASQPMRAREIHADAATLAGRDLLWSSVKASLAAGASGESPRFERLSRGMYRLAKHT
jgi:hypothetical protein